MFRPIQLFNSLLCLSLLFSIGCSSGGTGGTGANNGGSSVVVGTITQISTPATVTAIQQVTAVTTTSANTVTINGIQFDVSSSAITLDGMSGTEADLRVGMVATIKGSIDTSGTIGMADALSVNEAIKGPVTAIDQTNNTLTVLGQIIQASTATHWDNVTDISSIKQNDIVEVSGYVKNNNVIAATRIERLISSVKDYKVTGSISNFDVSAPSSFNLGTLLVDYSSADLSAVTNGVLSDGMYVEVNGTLKDGTLVAAKISTEQLEINNADSIELQGFVTSTNGTPVTSFHVNHQPVKIDGNTRFTGGAVTDIVPGVSVDVQGSLVNGVFTASLVAFEDAVNITAVVDKVRTGSFSLVGLGALSVSGDASTEFHGDMSKMSDLKMGNTVTIHGNLVSPDNITATQISLDSMSASMDITLQGPIDAIASDYSTVSILGVTIDTASNTTSIPDANFVVEGTATNSRNYFFSVVTTGDVVAAQGTLTGSLITWQSLSYENAGN